MGGLDIPVGREAKAGEGEILLESGELPVDRRKQDL